MSSQICHYYSTQVEAAVNHRGQPASGSSYTYLSLGFYFYRDDVALEDVGHFFCESTMEKGKGAQRLLKMQNQQSGCALFQERRSRPKMNGEAATALEKNLSQALVDLHPWALAAQTPTRDFLETRFLEEQLKLIKQMATT
eukprot:bmy_11314T0